MGLAGRAGLPRCLELAGAEFSDRLEQHEPLRCRILPADSNEVVSDETFELVEYVEPVDAGDGCNAVERESTREDAERAEDPLVVRFEQPVRPLDRRSERSLVLRRLSQT